MRIKYDLLYGNTNSLIMGRHDAYTCRSGVAGRGGMEGGGGIYIVELDP